MMQEHGQNSKYMLRNSFMSEKFRKIDKTKD